MTAAVYKILNKANGKFYIGSAICVDQRWRSHKHELRLNKHKNSYLQNAWNKYGESNFEFIVIEICSMENFLEKEQVWLDDTKCYDRKIGYNILTIASNSLGYLHTDESKIKMRQAQLGSEQSQEHKDNKAAAMRKLDKWPCLKGSRCRCDRCRLIKNEYAANWVRTRKNLNVLSHS